MTFREFFRFHDISMTTFIFQCGNPDYILNWHYTPRTVARDISRYRMPPHQGANQSGPQLSTYLPRRAALSAWLNADRHSIGRPGVAGGQRKQILRSKDCVSRMA